MPEPLIILAAPRTYTSVFGTMLGRHPETFGVPELNLFVGDTLGEIWYRLDSIARGSDGLLRLLAQLGFGEQTEETVAAAREWVLDHFHWTTSEVFEALQDLIGPKIITEKAPSLTFNRDFLERMLRIFPKASCLHLVRHPRSTARSLIDLRESLVGEKIGPEGNIVDPEKLWLRCHSNAAEFGATLPPGQYMRLKGEDAMREPHIYLPQICEWLGIDSSRQAVEPMLHPERSPFACIGPDSAPYGMDPNFLRGPKLDFGRLARIEEPTLDEPLSWRPEDEFSQPVKKLARQFGYH